MPDLAIQQLLEPDSKVVVIGLSKTGESVARHLLERGIHPCVVEEFYDADRMSSMAESLVTAGCEVVTGSGPGTGTTALEGSQLIIASPGVSPHSPILESARSLEIEVWSEIELAQQVLSERRESGDEIGLVGITGTNGKTTVVSMVTEVVRCSNRDTIACGNIGLPLLDAVTTVEDQGLLVAEVSSFQLYFTNSFRPDVAVLLNFAPDHLDWHSSISEYAESKGRIYEFQGPGDTAIWNAGDEEVVAIASNFVGRDVSRLAFNATGTGEGQVCIRGEKIVDARGRVIMDLGQLSGRTPSQIENSLAAITIGIALEIPREAILEGVTNFSSPAHRLEMVRKLDGVTFVDDSKATNPHAVGAAILSFDSVVLIAGGKNKGLDLRAIHNFGEREVLDRMKGVVAIGEAGADVARAFLDTGVSVVKARDMNEAVGIAIEMAAPGDVVLLSPGCASFDVYTSYAERGDDFRAAVYRRSARGDNARFRVSQGNPSEAG